MLKHPSTFRDRITLQARFLRRLYPELRHCRSTHEIISTLGAARREAATFNPITGKPKALAFKPRSEPEKWFYAILPLAVMFFLASLACTFHTWIPNFLLYRWFLGFALVVAAGVLWNLMRIENPTRRFIRRILVTKGAPICTDCGYDLRGLDDSLSVTPRCPECGSELDAASLANVRSHARTDHQ